jgi:uncharacterized damage-inducible protein DinB
MRMFLRRKSRSLRTSSLWMTRTALSPRCSEGVPSSGYANSLGDPSPRTNSLRGLISAMLTDVAAFLRYFETVHRRTLRDVVALPPSAPAWRAPRDWGENLWSFGEIVLHIAGGRYLFTGAFVGTGWHLPDLRLDPSDQAAWAPLLESALAWMRHQLAEAPTSWLERSVEAMDTSTRIAGWRLLLLMVEHEVHHRSQLDTYAGLAGWRVPDLFGYSFEDVQRMAPTSDVSN